MHKFTKALAAIGLAAVMSQSAIAETMKLGFWSNNLKNPGSRLNGNSPIRRARI
jgi:L-arabinose transport system substrate-binding protein